MKNEMTYEQAIKRLEEIVAKLDGFDISLDDSLKLYEEGTKLAAFCTKTLKNAEQKITEISGELK